MAMTRPALHDWGVDATLLHRATVASELLAAKALDTERLGFLPPETLRLIVDLGVPRMVMPHEWQGLERSFDEVVDVVAVLARGCMSAAWCAALYAEHAWILAHFDVRSQSDVWRGGPDVPLAMSIASFGRAERVPRGFRLRGTWPFASGCDHADWFILACESEAEHGAGTRSSLCLVPRSDVAIDHSSWHVAGLRGTGSKTVSVDGVFVPLHRVRDSDTLTGAQLKGPYPRVPLFCQPFNGTLGLVLVAVAVGGAEGALDYFRERIARRILPRQGRVQALDPAAQLDLAESAIQIRSARLLLEDTCRRVRVFGERFADLNELELAEARLVKAYVVRQCTAAVDRLFAASGGGALQEINPLQRYWRDLHAVQAHGGMAWSTTALNYGSLAAGLESTIRRPW
jgi:alkylation response protein AidB-like acyl-CoA dehydrogenase